MADQSSNTTSTMGTTTAVRRSPAQHLTEQMAAAQVTGPRGVSLKEIPFAPQLGVRARPGSRTARAVEDTLGVQLPDSAGHTTGDPAGLHAIWLSPDEFLVVDPSRTQARGETTAVDNALEGLPGQVLDLSGNRTILELSGPSARAVLEKGCHVDLHPREFPVGNAASTLLGPVQVIVHHSSQQTYRILPRSSFADYMVRWLIDGMLEFSSEEVL